MQSKLRNVMSAVSSFAVALSFSGAAAAVDGEDLTVITYNVQFLPGMASALNERKEPVYRASRIAEEMSKFDIVGLQETFHPRFREQIVNELREHWDGELNQFESPTPSDRVNGGCIVLTRLPILETNAMIFENYSTPEEYGVRADGYAAKGVIHARVAQDGNKDNAIDVYVTHLEARADHLRPLQYQEMAAFVKATADPKLPALFLGDFNTRGMKEYRDDPESQYNQLMEALNVAAGREIVDLWLALRPDELGGTSEQESADVGKRIDYIFLANPVAPAARLEPKGVEVKLYQDEKVFALSDHNAVAATFRWQ